MNIPKYFNLSYRSAEITKKIKKEINSLKNLYIYIFSLTDFQAEIYNSPDLLTKYFTSEEITLCSNRVSSLAGRYAAKNAIREILKNDLPLNKIQILTSQTGQPTLSIPQEISFSITHEDDLIAAVAAIPHPGKKIKVGLDASKISRFKKIIETQPLVIKKILTPGEFKKFEINTLNLCSVWTVKEAVSKALGTGIWHGASLQEIEVISLDPKPLIELKGNLLLNANTKSMTKWNLTTCTDENYILSLAVNS